MLETATDSLARKQVRGSGLPPRVSEGRDEDAHARLRLAVHELCQPLTALQCRLELAQMDGGSADLQEAISQSLEQCGRLALAVGKIRTAVKQM